MKRHIKKYADLFYYNHEMRSDKTFRAYFP